MDNIATGITILDIDYDIRIDENGHTIIMGCGTSLLAKLEVKSRRHDCYEGWYHNNTFILVTYDGGAKECSFSTTNIDVIVDLISDHIDAIEELGFEALAKED
jgi:hypothetical protein